MVLALFFFLVAQERIFSVVLPELQHSRHCSSEISLSNTSARFVDVEVIGHKATGALVGLVDRRSNKIRLHPSERTTLRLETEDAEAWAEVLEVVPSPRLHPVLSVAGKTDCLDINELVTATREVAPVVADPAFTLDYDAALLNGKVLLLINASDSSMQWSACYSSGTTVSDGNGGMRLLCSELLERTLAPYQSSRLAASIDGKPLVRFRARGPAVAMQMLTPSAPQVQLYKVESTIKFNE